MVESSSLSGLSEDEARSFHRIFVASFIGFTVIAIFAHVAVWSWRPWIPGVNGYNTSSNPTAPAVGAATVATSSTK